MTFTAADDELLKIDSICDVHEKISMTNTEVKLFIFPSTADQGISVQGFVYLVLNLVLYSFIYLLLHCLVKTILYCVTQDVVPRSTKT